MYTESGTVHMIFQRAVFLAKIISINLCI